MEEINPLLPVNNTPITSEIPLLYDNIKTKATQQSMSENYLNYAAKNSSFDIFRSNKIALQDYSVNVEDAYATLSNGDTAARYDRYVPGVDNNELAAQSQSTGDKWINGLAKFGAKTFNAIVGGTAGVVYGVGKAVEDGSLTALYDNEFSNTLNDWNTKLDYNLPNYYTKQESEQGLFGQAATANFWSDKVLGGLSFTAGAIVSEGIWAWATGGASIGLRAARWGSKGLGFTKVAQGINSYKNLLKSPLINAYRAGNISKTTAIALGRAGDAANTLRFALTSAGYEASVEALQYKNEAKENFYGNFQTLNGRQPTTEERQQFESDLVNSSNAVFGFNMAIVGTSNLVTLGKIFDLKNPIKTGLGDFIERKAFGRGITSSLDDAGKAIYKPIEATTTQKIARNVFAFGKSPLTEGLYEEGLQGVTNKTANKWIEHSYNPQLASDNIETAGLIYESLSEQYGTKEGWVDLGVGMIIGALGGTTTAISDNRQKNAEIDYKVAGANTFQGGKVIAERMLSMNRISGFSQEAAQEQQKGNIVKSRIATDGVLHSQLNHKYQLGEDPLEAVQEVEVSLNSMTTQQFKDAGVQESEIEDFKKEVLGEYANTARQFKQNRRYAEYVIGKQPIVGLSDVTQQGEAALNTNSQEALIQSLTWTLTAGENSARLMQDLKNQVSKEVGQDQSNVLNTISQLTKQRASNRGQITKTVNKLKALTSERDRLQNSILEVQNTPNETDGDRTAGRELGQLNLRLIEVENQIQGYTNEVQTFTDEINSQTENQRTLSDIDLNQVADFSTITPSDLINLDDNLKKFEKLVDSYKTVNPKRHQYLSDLLDEYSQAQELFYTNQSSAIALSSGNLKINNIHTWLGRKLSKNESMDEVTRDWMVDMLQNYQKNKVGTLSTTIEESITQEQYDDFINNNVVSEETIQLLADKTIRGEKLTPREQAIFNEKTSEIEEILRETPQPKKTIPATTQTLTEAEQLKQRLDNLLKTSYNSLTYIGESYDDLSLKKPTRAEIDEYRQLKEEDSTTERFQFLQQKLSNWRLLDSAVGEENQSIADIVDLITQLETTIELENTQDEITPEDVAVVVNNPEERATENIVRYDLAQNTLGSVTVKKTKEGNYRFSHLKMSSILNSLQIPFNSERIKVTVDGKQLKKVTQDTFENYKVGTVFYLDNTKVSVQAGNTLEILAEDYVTLKDQLNLQIIVPSINWSYFDVYEMLSNGEMQKRPSDFQEDINPQLIYQIQPEDNLTLQIANDSYNQGLRDRVLNEEMSEALEKEITNSLKIYVAYKGQPVSVLKAMNTSVAPAAQFMLLREMAKEAFIKNPVSPKINGSVKARKVFLGSPQISLENITLAPTAAQKVISTGYIQNGQVVLSREVADVDQTYISGFRNKAQKIPIIIIRKGAYNAAYPVSLQKSPNPVADRILSITENATLTETEKIKQINQQIIETGIAADKRLSTYDEAKIVEIVEEFGQNQTFISMQDFSSPNYRMASVQNDILINIDLDNLDKVIGDPKLEIDLQSIEIAVPQTDRYTTQVEVEERLNELAIELNNDYTQNAATKYTNSRGEILEDTTYTNVFDEGTVITEPASHLDKIRNTRALEQAFSEKLPKQVRAALSKETIIEIEHLLKKINLLRSQVEVDRDIVDDTINKNSCE